MSKYGKVIRVTKCLNCPCLVFKWNEDKQGYTDYACRNIHTTENEDVIENINKTPKWCPLEEYPRNWRPRRNEERKIKI